MRKHCGNCANYKKETNQFSEECGKCISARLENGETTDPSHWRALPQTNADRIRAMSDEELADWLASQMGLSVEDCHFGHFDIHQLRQAYRILCSVHEKEMKYDNYGNIYFD